MTPTPTPKVNLDNDVAAIVLAMQSLVPANKLVAVSHAVYQLAPILWSQYGREDVNPMRISVSEVGIT